LSEGDAAGWRGVLYEHLEDDGDPEVYVFCVACATREFGAGLRPINEDDLARRLGPRRRNALPWLFCSKCHRWSDDQARGWCIQRAGFLDKDNRPEHFTFCPDCAASEFGA
jgi:hypothetical protein